jgi:hypothetical protein
LVGTHIGGLLKTGLVLSFFAAAICAAGGQFTFNSLDVCQDMNCNNTPAGSYNGPNAGSTLVFGDVGAIDLSGVVIDGGADAYDQFGWVSNIGSLTLNSRTDSLSNNTFRWVLTFTNNTIAAISQAVAFMGDLGSDDGTTLLSSGTFYRVTGDSPDAASLSDPAVSLIFGNNSVASGFILLTGAGFNGSVSTLEREGYQIPVNLDPGQSVSYAFFSFLAKDDTDRTGDPALADSTAQNLVINPDWAGLTGGEIALIANFGSGPSTPEPATIALTGAALIGLALFRRRRR